jgi:hypothetical protein
MLTMLGMRIGLQKSAHAKFDLRRKVVPELAIQPADHPDGIAEQICITDVNKGLCAAAFAYLEKSLHCLPCFQA